MALLGVKPPGVGIRKVWRLGNRYRKVVGMSGLATDGISRVGRRLTVALTLASAALVALPAAASAQQISPTDAAYRSSLDLVAQGGGTQSPSASADSSSLPFTGLDLAMLAVVAAALVLAGLLLRRYRNTELDVR